MQRIPRVFNCADRESAAADEGPRQMKFTLMTRKGNKPQLKEIAVPVDSALVRSVQKHKVMNFRVCLALRKAHGRHG